MDEGVRGGCVIEDMRSFGTDSMSPPFPVVRERRGVTFKVYGRDMDPARSQDARDEAGWLEAYEAMARRLRPALVTFFSRRMGSRAMAEDLTQDLFMRLLRRHELFQLRNPDGYIFEAAANLIRDQARRARVRGGEHLELVDETPQADRPDAEQEVAARSHLAAVLRAVEALPPRTRNVLMLSRFEGLTYAEIGRRLKISKSAVEKHMARAMAALEGMR